MAELAPFDRHGADLGLLEESAAELVRLANQAIDQEAATMAAFDPATQSWEGVAAPELRAAPDGVQQDAFEVSSAVVWGSVPLRTWAAAVAVFNGKAAEYEAECAAELAALTMPADPAGSPNVALAVDSARATTRMHWERMWRDAYELHIVDGADAVARMYRDGPTEENLRVAGFVGAIPPASSGALLVLPALWHDANVRPSAEEAVAIANRILREGDPSQRDLERLNELLAEFGGDPAFAFHLLSGLGPERLLELTADVALIQRDEDGDVDDELATLVGSIQGGLGLALAAGTRPHRGDYYELGRDWERRLLDAGDERVHIDGTDWSPYGFHVLGVLMSNRAADFDSDFLVETGGRMIDFEMAHGEANVWGVSAVDFGGVRLNWVNGHGVDAGFGQDPIGGLMAALSVDGEAAQRFFTTTSPVDGEDESRVTYLLTERYWDMDNPYIHMEEPGAMQGLANFGSALEAGANRPGGEVIVRDIVTSVNEHGLVDDSLRRPLGNIAAHWIDSMYNSMRGGDVATRLGPADVTPFLLELGRDDGVRQKIVEATTAHLIVALDRRFDAPDGLGQYGEHMPDRDSQLSTFAHPSVEILRAVDIGGSDERFDNLQADQDRVANRVSGLTNALDLAGPWGTASASAIQAMGLDDSLANAFSSADAAEEADVKMRQATVNELMVAYWAAVHEHGGPAGHLEDGAFAELYRAQADLIERSYRGDAPAGVTQSDGG
jgi:hypothetical protein